jgi:hypothetical protein
VRVECVVNVFALDETTQVIHMRRTMELNGEFRRDQSVAVGGAPHAHSHRRVKSEKRKEHNILYSPLTTHTLTHTS